MDSNQVPLWAFLLTALAAALGPVVGLLVSNRNAVKLLRAQQTHETSTAERSAKENAYIEALTLYMPYMTHSASIIADSGALQDELSKVHAVHAKILAYGSDEVAVQSDKMVGAAIGFLAMEVEKNRSPDPEVKKMRTGFWKVFCKRYYLFEAAIRTDLGKEPIARSVEAIDPDRLPEFMKRYIE